ncbi:MAG TPA: amino acid adenylation domain-containing protein [Blastocatellia bacterium]|nr:amino acid adenylation domain-containing protein [Blastocatellia bacterium]
MGEPESLTTTAARHGIMNVFDQTIVGVLRRRAGEHPNRKAFSFMATPEDSPSCITYSELDRKASLIAGRLERVTEFGDRAVLMSPQGLEFIVALFGCLYAGRIAVPAFPPHGSRGLRRLKRIASDSGAKVILGDAGARASGRTSIAAFWPQMNFLSLDDDQSQPDAPLEFLPSPPDVAFLQYTSGSTGAPKGVIVSHANVLHNVTAIAEAFGQTSESSLVCWLPLFHDMGLVGNVLLNVFAGAHCLLIPPGRVMQRPVEWLRAISKTGATTSGGPNFIYDLCARKVSDDEIGGLDLSNWRVAYNGAEVVRPETVERFIARFGRCGFRPEAFRPCYGLAESTLLVSVSRQNKGRAVLATESGRMSCGDPAAGTQIVIVDPETTRLRGEGEAGEIWVSSPSVACGYWKRPDSELSFRARSVDDAERTYLRTGDLGFIRSGQLFVVDRLKDLIIVRGRNLYAHDVESTVLHACGDLAPGFGAAFAIEVAGEERLAVVQEFGKINADELRQAIVSIRAAIVQEHETAVAAIVLVRNGLLPRTTSGKVIRRECAAFLDFDRTGVLALWREQDEAAETTPAAEQEPRGVILEWLSRRFLLAPNEISADAPLVSLGLDSLGAVQLAHHLEQACGADADVPFILAGASLDELAAALTKRVIPGASGESPGTVPPVVGPLSYGQEALYYLQALNPDSGAYNVSVGLRVHGDLKREALTFAFNALATRHAALRTTFHEESGQRMQRVHPSISVALSWKDGADWPEQALNQYLRQMIRAPFVLDTGPLWRAHVVRRGDDDHILLWVGSHIIVDLWSLSLLLSGLVEFYEAATRGVSPDESPQGLSFLSHVIEEREFVAGARGERQRAYWIETLAETTERLKLPAWRDLAAPQTLDGESVRLILDRELSEKLRGLAATLGTTLAASLFAAYQILLWRFSRQDSFRIALVYAGRGDGRFANIVGYFVNLLVIKVCPRPDLSFAAAIMATQESVTAALRNGDYPYGLLVQGHQRGSAARQELFDAVFVMQSSPHELPAAKFAVAAGKPVTVAGLEFSPLPVETGAAQFDLTLTAADVDGKLALDLRYNTGIFTRSFAERMLAGLKNLLEQIVTEPGVRVGEAGLLAKSSATVRASDYAPRAGFDSAHTLVSLFERQASLRPGAVAISYGETRVTYAELNDSANALARRLIEVGVGPESLVALDPERRPDLIVAMLGVLKAGGAYVPVDQNWPRERLAWLLADARPAAVVTRTLSAFPPLRPEVKVVNVEDVEGAPGDAPPDRSILPNQLAYVIYTSGSTGVPKGSLLTHRNVVRLFEASQELFQFGPDDTWTMFHSPAFDFTVWEIYGALLHGGRLVIAPYEITRSPDEFYELLVTENVTVLSQTPSAFRQLAAAAARSGRRAERLRYVVFGGERLEPRMVEPWTAVYGFDQPKLVNMYGITETTVHVTHRVITEGDATLAVRSPIGVPLPDLSVRLLDPGMHLQPDGAVGAIFVAGAGVARGYLRRPDLTAAAFLPDPFASEPGARLYASGDLAVVSEDAGLEYLSREDQQIKIRGYRIESGETQAVIAKHPGVSDCIVLPYSRNGGDQRLVAYFIPRPGCEVAHGELRAWAMSRVPEYMVPSTFMALKEWPLTANGKLNRNALPDPALHAPARDAVIAPRTTMEFELARIFEEVLGAHPVGIEDNYFELGGDSIRSISVRALAQERGIEFTLRDLVECQTVAALAERARKVETRERENVLRIEPLPDGLDGIEVAYPLTSIFAGLLFHSQNGDDYESYVTSLHVRSPYDDTLLRQAIEAAGRRHAILRTTFDMDRFSEPMQLVHRESVVSLQVFDLRDLENERQEKEIAEVFRNLRAKQPDWSRLPLARWLVHRRSSGSFQLTLSEPFLDGWSVGLLLTEVLASYRGRLSGASQADLPPLRAVFRDNVSLERQALASEETHRFWDEQIRDLPACRLPRSTAAGEHHGLPIGRCEMKVEGPLLDAALTFAKRLGVSVKSLLLAAHLKAMSVMTGSQDVVTGLLVNTRPEMADGDRVVGLFTSGVPLRVYLSGGETWASLIRKAHQAEARLLPHRRFPFAEMKRLNGGRDLFEVVFNFTHFHIYSDLERASGVEIIDAYASEQTYFDLTAQFHIDRKQTSLVIALDYRVGRFEEATIRQMLAVYDRTLRRMTQRSESPHDDCCCAPPEEILFVADVNRTAQAWEPHKNLCDLVERQVSLTPGAPAVRFQEESLTYAELNARANQVARLLRRKGLSKDDVAAIMLDRSLDLVVLLLAILKAGAAYLPLDPEHPAERIRRICEDANAQLLIASSGAKVAPQQKCLFIDALMRRAGVESSTNLGIDVGPEALAYIIYTSGSTGTPKGAMNTHRGICNRLLWMQEQYGLSGIDRVLQKTPYTFDVSAWEFFWPLIAGACLVVASPEGHLDPEYLDETIRKESITTLHFVPAMLRSFLAETSGSWPSLRNVICSGEALNRDLVRAWYGRCGAALHNLYGPAEAAIDVTAHRCDPAARGPVPIGKPIANTRIYILDAGFQPVPISVEGEIFIAGVGVGRGYAGDPGLTGARFLPDPFADDHGARMYRTGDRGRCLRDGDIEFLGRLDGQVKIRGQRIEFGEIESALRDIDGVRDAVAALDGEGSLVAWVVFKPGAGLQAGDLRRLLGERLPRYMLPKQFRFQSELPLNRSGKIDRRLLLDQEAARKERRIKEILARVETLDDGAVQELLAGGSARL